MTEPSAEPIRTIDQVIKDNDDFYARETAAAKAPGGKAHATALRAMFGDQSSMIRDMWFTCFVNDPEPKWDALQQNWALFAALDDAALDAAAEKVIDELDAPHLRPIGILERANEGIAPSMHGLKNLLQYMANNLDD